MTEPSTLQLFTFALAVLGSVLGVINTWVNLDKNRVKIKVVPQRAIPVGGADPKIKFCIDITNLSSFPISISDAGVFYHGTKNRGATVSPIFSDGEGRWPKRLQPRESLTVYSQLPNAEPGKKIRCAYAKTQCGIITEGNSGALKQISRESSS